MIRKTLLSLIAILTLVVAGVFVVSAQDDTDDDATPTPYGRGMMGGRGGHGPGMMGGYGNFDNTGGFGFGMMWTDGQPMMVTLADALGLDFDAFVAALQDGQTLEEIADAQGVELDTVYDTLLADAEAHFADLVEAGTLTQEQADERLAWMSENIAGMPMGFGGGFGMMNGRGGFGSGMMGGGFGMMFGDGEPMWVAVAEALDLESDAFFAALQDGQTLEEIAEAQGVELDAVYNAALAQAGIHMGQMIEAGVITSEQAAEHLAWMSENIAQMPMFSDGGCMGSQAGFGMRGRGRGMWGN